MKLSRFLPALLMASAALLTGCGGGEPAPASSGLRQVGANPDVTAASNLMDLAETKFPQYFPSHRANATEAPFLYRYYPETGVYLGIPTASGSPYQYRGVYVMGGPFGSAPVYVAPMNTYLPSGQPPITALSTPAGTATFTVVYSGTRWGIDSRAATPTFALDNTMSGYYALEREYPNLGTMMTAEASGTTLVQVGRWNGGAFAGRYFDDVNGTQTFSLSANQGFHYALANPTLTLPCSGTATYTLAASTKPTIDDGSAAPGTLTALSVTASFVGGATVTLSVTGSLDIGGKTIPFSSPSAVASLAPWKAFFATATAGTSGLSTAGIDGVFAGADASEAGISLAGFAPNGDFNKAVHFAARLQRSAGTVTSCK